MTWLQIPYIAVKISLFLIVVALFFACGAWGQSSAHVNLLLPSGQSSQTGSVIATQPPVQTTSDATSKDIRKALLGVSDGLREGTTVIKWKPDFTYETLKKGTNRLVCYDRSGFPEHKSFSIECTSIANLPRVAQTLKFEAVGDVTKTLALIAAAEKDGTRVKPEYGSMWFHLSGDDQEHARTHTTISMPGATAQSTGLPDNAKQGGVWVMDPGTTAAHLMVPGT